MLTPILIAVYLIGFALVFYDSSRSIYAGPRKGDPDYVGTHFAGGNKRSAALVGLFYATLWPIAVVMFVLWWVGLEFFKWVQRGAEDGRA